MSDTERIYGKLEIIQNDVSYIKGKLETQNDIFVKKSELSHELQNHTKNCGGSSISNRVLLIVGACILAIGQGLNKLIGLLG